MSLGIKLKSKKRQIGVIVFCAANILLIFAVALHYALSRTPTEPDVSAIFSNDVAFRVHYLESSVFESGAVPHGKHYLMSYTDFIEIENSLAASFGQEVEGAYHYDVSETLLIRHINSSNRNSNPVVYEERFPVSEISGSISGSRVSFSGGDGEDGLPGGVYTVYPYEHIDIYRDFVMQHSNQMKDQDVTTDRALSFSAEILMEFSWNVQIDESGIDQTLTRGAIIPISSEVFLPELTGAPSDELIAPEPDAERPGLFSAVLMVAWFVAQVFGISYAAKQLRAEKAGVGGEIENLLKKYSDELVISSVPVDLAAYGIIPVRSFGELLKVAISSGKHILCHYDEQKAEFCVIDGSHAYFYNID